MPSFYSLMSFSLIIISGTSSLICFEKAQLVSIGQLAPLAANKIYSAFEEIDFNESCFLKDEFFHTISLVEANLAMFLVDNCFWHFCNKS